MGRAGRGRVRGRRRSLVGSGGKMEIDSNRRLVEDEVGRRGGLGGKVSSRSFGFGRSFGLGGSGGS